MFKWPIGRAGRGTMLGWLVLGSVGFSIVQWFAFQRLDLSIKLGFRADAISHFDVFPFWYPALELLFDIGLIVVAIARLHDIGKSGWWLATIAAAAVLATITGSGAIGLMIIVAWLALLLWPGTFGANEFGADRLGWESREQYEAQMQELRESARPRP